MTDIFSLSNLLFVINFIQEQFVLNSGDILEKVSCTYHLKGFAVKKKDHDIKKWQER